MKSNKSLNRFNSDLRARPHHLPHGILANHYHYHYPHFALDAKLFCCVSVLITASLNLLVLVPEVDEMELEIARPRTALK